MLQDDGSSLNDTERKVRDILKAKLGKRATVTKIKQVDKHISIEVVSQNDFPWTGEALHEVADEIVEATGLTMDVSLGKKWLPKAQRDRAAKLEAEILSDLGRLAEIIKKQ